MTAFQFPDPLVQTTVKNPITGSTYQWKEPPGKWVMTVSIREVEDIIWEGDAPPNPIGDYKLWYSTDTLELYYYYCDVNGVCTWIPTSVPGRPPIFSDTEPTVHPDSQHLVMN